MTRAMLTLFVRPGCIACSEAIETLQRGGRPFAVAVVDDTTSQGLDAKCELLSLLSLNDLPLDSPLPVLADGDKIMLWTTKGFGL